MRRTSQAGFATIAAIFLTAILYLAAGPTPAAADNARWGANYFPNVVLTTQDGVKVHFYDDVLKGKSVVIDLIYTTVSGCMPAGNCPAGAGAKDAGRSRGQRHFLLFHQH